MSFEPRTSPPTPLTVWWDKEVSLLYKYRNEIIKQTSDWRSKQIISDKHESIMSTSISDS